MTDARYVGERVTGPDEIDEYPPGTVLRVYEREDGTRYTRATLTGAEPNGRLWRAQRRVRDELATPEQVEVRHQGMYDPRPASGVLIGKRVTVRCGACGEVVAEVVDYQRRVLVHRPQDQRWLFDRPLDQWSSFWCSACSDRGHVDLDAIRAALVSARAVGNTRTVKA